MTSTPMKRTIASSQPSQSTMRAPKTQLAQFRKQMRALRDPLKHDVNIGVSTRSPPQPPVHLNECDNHRDGDDDKTLPMK